MNDNTRHERSPDVDDRMPMARAYQRATRGITVALGMVIPGLLGYGLDRLLEIVPVLTVGGFALGMILGIRELMRMGQTKKSAE